ncbi:MAG: N-acetylglucosamine kinase [Thermoprotei archaeon]
MKSFMGVDGGGTKTLAVLISERGKLLGYAEGGPTNYAERGKEEVIEELLKAINKASGGYHISSLCVGLAGLARSEELSEMNEILSRLNLADRSEATSDGLIALYAATRGKPGLVLISGTGSIAWGMDEARNVIRADGWGYLLGDRGSGFDIGRSGMVAAFQAYDGRGMDTTLLPAMLEHFSVSSPEQLIRIIYGRRELAIPMIAGFAPTVIAEAKKGDKVAAEIVEEACAQLSLSAKAVMGKLSVSLSCVYVAGSLFKDQFFRSIVEKKLGTRLLSSPLSPVMGAVIRAAQNVGFYPNEDFFSKLSLADKRLASLKGSGGEGKTRTG